MIWPVLLIPIELFFAIAYLSVDALLTSFVLAILVTGLVFGLGLKYGYRGINPPSRNLINVNDGNYFEWIGPDESDYP
ncbi:MAG: hypothetical protein ACFFEF_09345 [Candidatus Thorarchaeota archaeon]